MQGYARLDFHKMLIYFYSTVDTTHVIGLFWFVHVGFNTLQSWNLNEFWCWIYSRKTCFRVHCYFWILLFFSKNCITTVRSEVLRLWSIRLGNFLNYNSSRSTSEWHKRTLLRIKCPNNLKFPRSSCNLLSVWEYWYG